MRKPPALLEGGEQLFGIPRFEGLRAAAELRREHRRRLDAPEDLAQDLFAVGIRRRGVEVVDAEFERLMDRSTALLEARSERGREEAAEREFADDDAGLA